MGVFRKMLAEGKDLASVVAGIKSAIGNFKAYQDQQEALFRKELTQVEDQAMKALADIAKVLEKNRPALEAVKDSKWGEQINKKLVECGQAVMGVVEPIMSLTAKPEKTESSEDCPACKGSGQRGKDECEVCQGTGMMVPEPAMSKRKSESKKSK